MQELSSKAERFSLLISEDVHTAAWRYAWRLSDNAEDAEDLLQNALTKAYQRLEQLHDDSQVKGWLFAIVRTLYLDGLRKTKRDQRLVASVAATSGQDKGVNDLVRKAVATLPSLQREAIELFHFDELSLKETAATLGVSVNNIKNRLFRARQALARRLKPSLLAGDLEGLL